MKITIDIKDKEDPRRVLYEAYQNIDETLKEKKTEDILHEGGLITDDETDDVLALISIER